ncbi:MAG: hypothetical protein KatS3mg027_0797 [Bacteroidia bacterium]|nr:MAG: hypothetical protein KatS3mg027_0797 [Bacteroidia bacterium]
MALGHKQMGEEYCVTSKIKQVRPWSNSLH